MAKSQESWNKKEIQQKKDKKRKEKEKKRLEKKSGSGGGLDNMFAYVDENGMLTDVPTDPSKKLVVNTEDIQISVPKKEKQSSKDLLKEGVVIFFNESKGYGFIREIETRESIFVHQNELVDMIQENDRVSFEVAQGKKGLMAVTVRKL